MGLLGWRWQRRMRPHLRISPGTMMEVPRSPFPNSFQLISACRLQAYRVPASPFRVSKITLSWDSSLFQRLPTREVALQSPGKAVERNKPQCWGAEGKRKREKGNINCTRDADGFDRRCLHWEIAIWSSALFLQKPEERGMGEPDRKWGFSDFKYKH